MGREDGNQLPHPILEKGGHPVPMAKELARHNTLSPIKLAESLSHPQKMGHFLPLPIPMDLNILHPPPFPWTWPVPLPFPMVPYLPSLLEFLDQLLLFLPYFLKLFQKATIGP